MTDYKDLPLFFFADAARSSNPELSAVGNSLVDNYSGKWQATFDNHEGEGAEDTAKFLASAREMVLELVRRVVELEDRIQPMLRKEYQGRLLSKDDAVGSLPVAKYPSAGALYASYVIHLMTVGYSDYHFPQWGDLTDPEKTFWYELAARINRVAETANKNMVGKIVRYRESIAGHDLWAYAQVTTLNIPLGGGVIQYYAYPFRYEQMDGTEFHPINQWFEQVALINHPDFELWGNPIQKP